MSPPIRRLCCILAFALAVPAAAAPVAPALDAPDRAAFAGQADAVRDGMAPGGRYAYVTPAERHTVERLLADMNRVLSDRPGTAPLPQADVLALLNAQEEINAILARRDGERLVCTQAVPTGSHRSVSRCNRYADIERERLASEKLLRDVGATSCANRDCSGR